MKTILLSLLLFVGSYPDRAVPPKADLEAVLNHVLNHTELTRFINPYVETHDVLYFRFGRSPVYSGHELETLKDIVVRVKDGSPLVYDTYQDETQKPVIYVIVTKLTLDTAEVRIGLAIEGAVGVFTLTKKGIWTITKSDVYQT